MLKEKNIDIKIYSNMIPYYKNILKNENIKYGDVININIKDLPKGSHHKVTGICDICEKENKIMYKTYVKLIEKDEDNFYYCKKCASSKISKTLNRKYGVNHALQNKEFLFKQKETMIERYGYDSPIKIKEINDKRKKTMIERYGTEHALCNIEIKEKLKEKIKNRTIQSYLNKGLNILEINENGYKLYCEKGHEYYINIHNLIDRLKYKVELCNICNPIDKKISNMENQLYDFVINYNNSALKNYHEFEKELDIYIPELKLAFEFNGIFWHNEIYRNKTYHLEKTEMCENYGIQLIHIYEDDWIYKQDIVKSIILNKLNKTLNRIYARKCEIREVDNKESKLFLENNHIQGNVNAKYNIGLYYENDLVSLMTFGKKRKFMNSNSKENEYEMLRFCNKVYYNVVGGASKLFNHFIKTRKPKEIITYADRGISIGNLYKLLGFEYIGKTIPNYYYVIDGLRKHRFGFRKDILVKQGYDVNKTEHEIMLDRKIYRIYDSGHFKFRKIIF